MEVLMCVEYATILESWYAVMTVLLPSTLTVWAMKDSSLVANGNAISARLQSTASASQWEWLQKRAQYVMF